MGAGIIALMLLVALAAPLPAPYDPEAGDFGAKLARPSAAPSLGPGTFGRGARSRGDNARGGEREAAAVAWRRLACVKRGVRAVVPPDC